MTAGRTAGFLAREFEQSEQMIRNLVKQADLDDGRRSDGLATEACKEMREVNHLPSWAGFWASPSVGTATGCTEDPLARARRDAELKGGIVAIWIESGGIYGRPRIHAALLAQGERMGRKRVARLMRELGIESVTRRRFKTGTTKRDGSAKAAPDLVKPELLDRGPRDQLWVADITYVRT